MRLLRANTTSMRVPRSTTSTTKSMYSSATWRTPESLFCSVSTSSVKSSSAPAVICTKRARRGTQVRDLAVLWQSSFSKDTHLERGRHWDVAICDIPEKHYPVED
mmetsp:Transcript_1275/g.3754  ORF Transcript_1275/g.3754 Transcript_1275/m.3754 type:complete len:105 (+) Transcript_1275:1207-1521(+)